MSTSSSSWKTPVNIEKVLLVGAAGVATLFSYWFFVGSHNRLFRKSLISQLNDAKLDVSELEDQLATLESEIRASKKKKEIRIFVDGAFDLFHFGHMNAFRQARALGTFLIVGVNSDESVARCKGGAPVMNDSERLAAVKACRWADLVLPEVPYVMNEEYINYLFEHHNVDYVVHGDDPCIVDGKDVYATAKQAGKYKSIPRTEGISTTDVVGRILMLAEEQPPPPSACEFESHEHISSYSNFLTTTHKLRQFTDNVKAPHEGSTVVYIPGCWDMYHSGHVAMLEKAREFGDYVIVGVYNDHLVHNLCNEKDATAGSYPILSMSERTLSVAGCRHTDDVLMDAPYMITEDMLNGMHISVVLVNKKAEMTIAQTENQKHLAVAKQNGKLKVIDFRKHDSLSGAKVANRILAQHDRFIKKYNLKKQAETDFYNSKYGAGGAVPATK